ncbi:hypothetical protein TH63_00620 [Rufibacter radiotolerans]|uniref:Uncharacterized protein n=1 Tax=Rufibacter radiotolerans TaxID=1379910 RepID=A0A0H4VKR2_9BACT|nr:hypothetical protein [Rufibacter radiotolerans]AKQ44477.1 hypothetical protein TH63_00620 [Rufibacter radiotolerans]
MPAPTLPLKEKIKIYLGCFLLTLAIYTVIDMYVPMKKLWAGEVMSFQELVTHIQWHKKAPFIALITFLMGRSTIKKRTKALTEGPAREHEAVAQ